MREAFFPMILTCSGPAQAACLWQTTDHWFPEGCLAPLQRLGHARAQILTRKVCMHTLLSAAGCSHVNVPPQRCCQWAGRAVSGACSSTVHILSKTGKLPFLGRCPPGSGIQMILQPQSWLEVPTSPAGHQGAPAACTTGARCICSLRCLTTLMLAEQIRGEQHAFAVQSAQSRHDMSQQNLSCSLAARASQSTLLALHVADPLLCTDSHLSRSVHSTSTAAEQRTRPCQTDWSRSTVCRHGWAHAAVLAGAGWGCCRQQRHRDAAICIG